MKKPTLKTAFKIGIAVGVLNYFYMRTSIKIIEVNKVAKTIKYKAVIGYKSIEGVFSVNDPMYMQANYYGKTFRLDSERYNVVTLTITDKKGNVLQSHTENFEPTGIVQNDYEPNNPIFEAKPQHAKA